MTLTLFYIALIFLNALVALYDFSFYRIPNMLVLALLIFYLGSAPLLLSWNDVLFSGAIFAGTLLFGFVLFFFGIFGGGDAKYLAVTSLWAGQENLLLFIFVMTLMGGALALAYLFAQSYIAQYSTTLWNQIVSVEKRYTGLRYVWAFSGNGHESKKSPAIEGNKLPYGMAIAAGMIAVLYWKMTT